MKTLRFLVAALVVCSLVSPAHAAEKEYQGTLVCAKCYLKKADAKECQDVLLVDAPGGARAEYYITKNDVAKRAGEACTQEVKAKVSGTVEQKDGKTWLTPSRIEKQ